MATDITVPGASLLPVGGGVVNDVGTAAVTPFEDAAKAGLDAAGLGGVSTFLADVSDGRMWASLGWILLGLVLIIMGILLWLKKSGNMPSAGGGGGGGGGGLALAEDAAVAA